ncbi:hypothetical protein Tco_1576920 [Tanacetum coccineum]
MADDRPMAEQLQAPTGGFESAIVVPIINAQNFELKSSLINLVQNRIFRGGNDEEPHAHIRHFESITNNQRYPDVPNTTIKLLLFPFSLDGVAKTWLDKEPPNSILTWDDLVSKNEMNENKNMMKALVPTPVPIKAVEEKCTTCGSNHSFNVCPMTRGGYESPVYHDNFQQFQQTASVVDNSPPSKEPSKETKIPYPSRVDHEKKGENDKVQIQKFWEMFKKIHVDITLAECLDLMPK